MKTAIFGGTFDPVHLAHLVIAREAADKFGLDRVLFIPAGNPPHKKSGTPFEHRYRMVERACVFDQRFEPSRLEEGNGISYSIDTIEKLKAPDQQLFFLIGSDAFSDIQTWHRWKDVVDAVEFIVVSRPGNTYAIPDGAKVHRLDTVVLPVSSSEIRRELSRGETSLHLPPGVGEYIRSRGLYQDAPE